MLRSDLATLIYEEQQQQTANRIQEQLFRTLEDVQNQLRYEPELQGWSASSASATERDLPMQDLTVLRRESLRAYYKNPHGRVVIRNLVKFIIGGGSIIDFREESEEGLNSISEWWRTFTKKTKWFKFQREILTRSFRDGEVFIRKFAIEGEPLRLRFIDPDRIPTENIGYDDQDKEVALTYKIKNGSQVGEEETVDATDIIHIKLDVDSNVRRGHPILESMLTDLGEFRQWRKARMVLNIVRTSVALVKEVKGSPNDLSRLRLSQKAVRNDSKETDKQKMLRPGTIISGTAGVEYKMLAPNLDAKDAAEDGEMILRSIASAAGFPDAFVTANWGGSNFASSVVSQTIAVREFEDWGNFFLEYFADIIAWVLEDGVEQSAIPVDANLDFDITFPPFIRRDMAQENTAYQIMWESGIISSTTWAAKMGFDSDKEQRLREEEKSKGIIPPMPTPTSPAGGVPPSKRAPKRVEDRQPRSQVQVA